MDFVVDSLFNGHSSSLINTRAAQEAKKLHFWLDQFSGEARMTGKITQGLAH
jgi:hypothetical protein